MSNYPAHDRVEQVAAARYIEWSDDAQPSSTERCRAAERIVAESVGISLLVSDADADVVVVRYTGARPPRAVVRRLWPPSLRPVRSPSPTRAASTPRHRERASASSRRSTAPPSDDGDDHVVEVCLPSVDHDAVARLVRLIVEQATADVLGLRAAVSGGRSTLTANPDTATPPPLATARASDRSRR